MKTDIWMPIYIGDYLADTARLTTEQHGAYLLLLMDYWRSGRLPDNDQVLAQICKLSPDAWSNAKAMLIPFFSIEDGFWIHKRVEEELSKSAENKVKKHERAVKGANARWNNALSNASSNAQAMLNECPSPSPSPSKKNNIYTEDFELFWKAYPRHESKSQAMKSWKSTKPDLQIVLKAIEIQKQGEQWKRNIIPHASTWLNQRRWEDEVVGGASQPKWRKLPNGIYQQFFMGQYNDMKDSQVPQEIKENL